MAKSSDHSHTHYHIGLILLFLLAAAVAAKLWIRQEKWNSYVVDSQATVNKYKMADSVEDAGMIASTIVSVPSENSLIKQPQELEKYVEALGHATGRDIVIMDTKRKILADTVPMNVGTIYSYGQEAIERTMIEGIARTFIENSADYPSGINETVVSFKDTKGTPMGAILISDSKIF